MSGEGLAERAAEIAEGARLKRLGDLGGVAAGFDDGEDLAGVAVDVRNTGAVDLATSPPNVFRANAVDLKVNGLSLDARGNTWSFLNPCEGMQLTNAVIQTDTGSCSSP